MIKAHISPADLIPSTPHLVLHPLSQHKDGSAHMKLKLNMPKWRGVLMNPQVVDQLPILLIHLL